MTFCCLTIYKDNPLLIRLCIPNSTFYRILTGFHRTFATGVAYRQGTLTILDTWSRPFGDLHMFYLWKQILFPNWSLFFRTIAMLFEYPSVLSRLCILTKCWNLEKGKGAATDSFRVTRIHCANRCISPARDPYLILIATQLFFRSLDWYFFNIIYTFLHILLCINVMVDLICIGNK